MLHTLYDGTIVRTLTAKELIAIPIWHGNRILNSSHVEKIKFTLQGNIKKLDHGYRIVSLKEEDAGGNMIQASYIIDGQHRHRVLSDYFQDNLCEPDFLVVVYETHLSCESEIISCFKELNNQMPILWKTDPNMLANEYIQQLLVAFHTKLIRPKATTRPYLSVEKLREGLLLFKEQLKETPHEIRAFVERVKRYNEKEVSMSETKALFALKKGEAELLEKASKLQFMLAIDPKLPWLKECLF